MKNLIPITQKVYELLSRVNLQSDFHLPTIVTIGVQSAGKSSVLQAIIGKEVLPIGIPTLKPVVINLKNDPRSEDYAIFDHLPEKRLTDFSYVRRELASRMDQEDIDPVIVTLYSKDVLDLTLVDLPNLGETMWDIIHEKNCILLAVAPGSAPEVPEAVYKVDPKEERTIKVLTKLDLVDCKKVNIKHALKAEGWIGIVCRSRRNVMDRKSIEDSIKEEESYFAQHSAYSTLKDCCGTTYLCEKLSKMLKRSIVNILPKLKAGLSTLLHTKLQELSEMGIEPNTKEMYNTGVLHLISKFVKYYEAELDGAAIYGKTTKEFQGGARVNYIFHEIYDSDIARIEALDGLTDEDIRTAIINSKSLHPSLFIPEKAFETLVKEQIKKLLEPSLICMRMVNEELKKVVLTSNIPELSKYKRMKERIEEVMLDLLRKCTEPAEEMIRNLIRIQDSYINIHHPDVLAGNSAIIGAIQYNPMVKERGEGVSSLQSRKSSAKTRSKSMFGDSEDEKVGFPFVRKVPLRATDPASSREILETEIIKQLLVSYFKVVKKNIADLVPKAIMGFLVNRSKETAKNELVSALYESPQTMGLMAEESEVTEKREKCKKAIDEIKEIVHELEALSHK